MAPTTVPAAPTRRALLRGPVVAAGAVVAAFLLVRLVDPHTPGRYPVCPTYALFGVYCPLCGGLRGANDLTHGDLTDAFRSNALVVLGLPVAVGLWLWWTVQRARGRPADPPTPSPRLQALLAVVLLAFAVLRNLPVGAALRP